MNIINMPDHYKTLKNKEGEKYVAKIPDKKNGGSGVPKSGWTKGYLFRYAFSAKESVFDDFQEALKKAKANPDKVAGITEGMLRGKKVYSLRRGVGGKVLYSEKQPKQRSYITNPKKITSKPDLPEKSDKVKEVQKQLVEKIKVAKSIKKLKGAKEVKKPEFKVIDLDQTLARQRLKLAQQAVSLADMRAESKRLDKHIAMLKKRNAEVESMRKKALANKKRIEERGLFSK